MQWKDRFYKNPLFLHKTRAVIAHALPVFRQLFRNIRIADKICMLHS